MRNFFQALSRQRVRYLLISGQATVLYGASTFSEDVDIWVEPTPENWMRLLAALRQAEARVYKLTPPLTLDCARRGHGFHFTVSDKESPAGIGYVDVMAMPPRVGTFNEAARRAWRFVTDWGRLPVVAPADLILLKKTRRLADYAVISALVRLACRRFRSQAQWQWALEQTYEAEDLLVFWQRGRPGWHRQLVSRRPVIQRLQRSRRLPSTAALARPLADEMERAREADRKYWQPVLSELRDLQRRRLLLREGTAVVTQRSLEDVALVRAIQAGEKSPLVSRKRIFQRLSRRS